MRSGERFLVAATRRSLAARYPKPSGLIQFRCFLQLDGGLIYSPIEGCGLLTSSVAPCSHTPSLPLSNINPYGSRLFSYFRTMSHEQMSTHLARPGPKYQSSPLSACILPAAMRRQTGRVWKREESCGCNVPALAYQSQHHHTPHVEMPSPTETHVDYACRGRQPISDETKPDLSVTSSPIASFGDPPLPLPTSEHSPTHLWVRRHHFE